MLLEKVLNDILHTSKESSLISVILSISFVKTWLIAKLCLIIVKACSGVNWSFKYSGNLIKLSAWSKVKLLGFILTPSTSNLKFCTPINANIPSGSLLLFIPAISNAKFILFWTLALPATKPILYFDCTSWIYLLGWDPGYAYKPFDLPALGFKEITNWSSLISSWVNADIIVLYLSWASWYVSIELSFWPLSFLFLYG